MMYPSYKNFIYGATDTKKFSASTLSTPPLLKMKFMNLIAKYDSRADSLKAKKLPRKDADPNFDGPLSPLNTTQRDLARQISVKYGSDGDALEDGLLVVPGNVSMNPKIEEKGAIINGNVAIPFEIEMQSSYTVLHEHDMGFNQYYPVGAQDEAARLEKLLNVNKRKLQGIYNDISDFKQTSKSLANQQTSLHASSRDPMKLDIASRSRDLDNARNANLDSLKRAEGEVSDAKKAVSKARKRLVKARKLINKIKDKNRAAETFDQFPYGASKPR